MKATKLLLITAAIIAILVLILNSASALTITSVTSNPTELQPGEKVSLELRIENNLKDIAENVVVNIDLKDVPFAPYQSSSQVSFEEIKESKSKTAKFELIANPKAESGTYKIPVKISHFLDDEEKEYSGLVSLIINALPKLELSSDSFLIKGKNNDLTIKIINSGLGESRLLSLKILPVIGIKILGSDTSYLGNIEGDDFDSVEFKVVVSENVPSSINIPIELDYQDSRNNPITENKNLAIKTYTEKEAVKLGLIKKSNTATIVVSIVFLVILIFVYRFIRKRLKKRKLEQEV